MAFDIYGNDLRPGYCEVHPQVGEEYPCWICCKEIDQENERQRLNREFQQAQDRDYQKAMEKEYLESVSEYKIFEIDFEGHVLTKLKFENGQLEVLGAINGYGNAVSPVITEVKP